MQVALVLEDNNMKKEDKLLETLTRIAVILVILFCVWINYEFHVESQSPSGYEKDSSQVSYNREVIGG